MKRIMWADPDGPAVRNFTIRLVLMKDEAARLGLFKTMHALHEAERTVGYEIAGLIDDGTKPKRRRK